MIKLTNKLKIFQTTDIPDYHKNFKISKKVSWYTWSDNLHEFLSNWSKDVKVSNRIQRTNLYDQKFPHETYTLDTKWVKDQRYVKQLKDISIEFYKFKHNSKPIFLQT